MHHPTIAASYGTIAPEAYWSTDLAAGKSQGYAAYWFSEVLEDRASQLLRGPVHPPPTQLRHCAGGILVDRSRNWKVPGVERPCDRG